MKKVCFIIVTYNSENYIGRCLDSILLYEPDSGIIVIDNNSKDNTVHILSKYEKVDVIISRKNLGFGKGNNLAIDRAIQQKYEYVFLLNDDAFLLESMTIGMEHIFKSNSKLGILSPVQIDEAGHRLEEKFRYFMAEQSKLEEIENALMNKNYNRDLVQVEFCQAASWMLPCSLLKKIGSFNPLFFHYGEDNEFVNRLRYINYDIGIAVNFKVSHRGNPKANNYVKNYNGYHRNRKLSKWINNCLNLNQEFSQKLVMREFINVLRFSLSQVIQFKMNVAIRAFRYLVSMIWLFGRLKRHRQKLSLTLLKYKG